MTSFMLSPFSALPFFARRFVVLVSYFCFACRRMAVTKECFVM